MAKEKDLGKISIQPATCITDRERQFIPLSPAIQSIMGGLLGGSFVIVSGGFKMGKSALCLDFAKRAQRVGYKVLYCDIEHRLSKRDLLSTKGLDLSEDKFEVMRSSPGNILDAEDFVSLIRARLESGDKIMAIADSVSQLCPRDLRQGEIGDAFRDPTPAILSRFSKVLAPTLGITNNIFVAITHVIANTSGRGHKLKVEASGNKIQYAMDFKLEVGYATPWLEGETVVGQDVHWECVNSILVKKGMEATGKFRYGTEENPEGIDEVAELFDLAETYGIISKSGAWYSCNGKKEQGAAKFIKLMKEDAETFNFIQDSMKVFLES